MTVIMQVVKEGKEKTFRAEIRENGLHVEFWARPADKLVCLQTTLDEESVQDLRTLCDITLQKMQEARWRAREVEEEDANDRN